MAQEIVREAGALALGYFKDTGSLTITDKGVNDMVSDADVETERLLRERFAAVPVAAADDEFPGAGRGAFSLRPAQPLIRVCTHEEG